MPKKPVNTKNRAKKRHTNAPTTVKATYQIRSPKVLYVATRNDRRGLFDTAGRIAGNALALGSVAIASPFIFFVQAFLTSLDNIILSGRSDMNDLKQREYRDELGEVHHHTHRYLQDHPNQLRTLAA